MDNSGLAKITPRFSKFIIITLTIATSTVPIFYLIGYLFDAGNLSVYGLNTEYFPRDAQYYYINAVIAYFSTVKLLIENWDEIISGILYYGFIYALLGFVIVILVRWFKKINKQKFNKNIKAIKNWKNMDFIIIPLAMSGVFVLPILIFIFSTIFIALLILAPYQIGVKEAEKNITKYQGCTMIKPYKNEECTLIYNKNAKKNDLPEAKGIFITRSLNYIALYDGVATIYPIKDKKISVIKYKKKELKRSESEVSPQK